MSSNEPISADDAYQGTGSNDELWPILVSHDAVTDPSDARDSYLATVLINWRNAACKDVAGQYHEQRERAKKLEAELTQTRESLELNEAQLVEVTLERAEWRKQAQQYETVAKILRADLAAASRRAETAERELADACDTNVSLREGGRKLRAELDRCAELNRKLANESADFQVERDQARDALAALRGRLRTEWGYGPHTLDVVSTSSAAHAGEVARRRGEKQWTRLKTDWAEVSNDD